MTMRILIATVGGSCAPVVCSIRDHAPDRVCFICSHDSRRLADGSGNVCDGRASIVAETGLLPEQYAIYEIDAIDDPQRCFAVVTRAYEDALTHDNQPRIIADYTGGTKTMTAALVRAATGRYAAYSLLSVVTGERTNLRSVQDGTETAHVHDAMGLAAEEQWDAALTLANTYHYGSAADVVARILRQAVPSALRQRAQTLLTVCRGLDAWDRFDHSAALPLIRPHARRFDPELLSTLATLGQGLLPSGTWNAASLLPVYDLLRNAERRAAQQRFDDAVARLYRAMEMTSQARLRGAYAIDTSNVDPARVPDTWLQAHLAPRGSKEAPPGRLRIGLRDSYALLSALDDPVGHIFERHETRVGAMLERRNHSILAHGIDPIGATGFEPEMLRPVVTLVDEVRQETCSRLHVPPQFPLLTVAMISNGNGGNR